MLDKTKKQKKYYKESSTIVNRIFIAFCVSLSVTALLGVFTAGPIQKKSFMGAEYCGSCHKEEYKSWSTSAHAKATSILPPEKATEQQCLTCHATGMYSAKDNFFSGVQCESCHGPGQYYASLHVKKDPNLSKLLFMQKPDIQSCRHCHLKDENLWSPHKAMKDIDHWSKPYHQLGDKKIDESKNEKTKD